MNLGDFCRETKSLFLDLAKGDMNAKEKIVRKMGKLEIEYSEIFTTIVSQKEWENNECEDIQQKICILLLEDKLTYGPSMASLRTYLRQIIVNLLLDGCRKKKTVKKYQKEKLKSEKEGEERDKVVWEESSAGIKLKPECYAEVQMQSCLGRVVLKLCYPYFFQYEFEPDETRLMIQKGVKIDELRKRLKAEVEDRLEKEHKNIAVSAEWVGKWLGLSRDCIDQHLKRLRQRLTWLQKGNLRHALAESECAK